MEVCFFRITVFEIGCAHSIGVKSVDGAAGLHLNNNTPALAGMFQKCENKRNKAEVYWYLLCVRVVMFMQER